MLWREVQIFDEGKKVAGSHNIQFDASAHTSGIYLYRSLQMDTLLQNL